MIAVIPHGLSHQLRSILGKAQVQRHLRTECALVRSEKDAKTWFGLGLKYPFLLLRHCSLPDQGLNS